MAGPIRRLQFVLEQIRLSRFKPDMTRSGYFPGAASEETENITDDNTTDSPESSDSEDSADEEDDAEDKTLIEKAADAELDAWSEHATIESLALDTLHLCSGMHQLDTFTSWPMNLVQDSDVVGK